MNKDGKIDLLISTPGTNGLQVLIGNGAGGFTQAAPINLGGTFALITVSDLNSDGNDDLLLAGGSSSTPLGVMLGDGSGGFSAEVNLSNGNYTNTIVAEDVRQVTNTDFSQVTFRLPKICRPAYVWCL